MRSGKFWDASTETQEITVNRRASCNRKATPSVPKRPSFATQGLFFLRDLARGALLHNLAWARRPVGDSAPIAAPPLHPARLPRPTEPNEETAS